MTLEGFSNLNDSVIPGLILLMWQNYPIKAKLGELLSEGITRIL